MSSSSRLPGSPDGPRGEPSAGAAPDATRNGTHELALQQMAFFRRELRRGVEFLSDTPGLARTPGVRRVLESVLDTATDLNDALLSKFALPSLAVAQSAEPVFEEAGIGRPIEDEDTGPVTSPEMLAGNLQALQEQVVVVRESLVDNESLADLFARGEDFLRAMAGGELLELASTLKELLDKCGELISMMPVPEDDDAAARTAAEMAARLAPPVAPRPPAAVPHPPAAMLVYPEGPAVVAPRPPSVVLLPTEEPAVAQAPTPSSGETLVRSLQDFFNQNSPEGALLKACEPEFARMVAGALVSVCPEVTVSGAELAARIKVLKDTFALRKKLSNTLTLREFKAFFGAPR